MSALAKGCGWGCRTSSHSIYVYLDIYKDTYICCRFFVRATHVTFCDGRNMSKWWQFDDGSKVIYIQLVYVNKFTWLLEFAIALCMGELQLSDYTQLQMGMTVNSESCWWMITDEIATCFNINVLKPRELQRELERYSNETTDFTGTFQRGTLQFLNYHTMSSLWGNVVVMMKTPKPTTLAPHAAMLASFARRRSRVMGTVGCDCCIGGLWTVDKVQICNS